LTDHGQRSTALLIEPQTFFSLVSGEKADNQIEENKGKHFSSFQNGAIQIVKLLWSTGFQSNSPYFPTFLNKLPTTSLIFFIKYF
jgi:hypothetical protein